MARNLTEIIVTADAQRLARYVLGPGEYLIGRDPSCRILVDVPDVSQRHAKLSLQEDECLWEDLGSSNGSFVAGERVIGTVRLRLPQRIRIGSAELVLNLLPERCDEAPARTAVPDRFGAPFETGLQKARNYSVGSEVARGGMGAILEAQDLNIRRKVAMKVMLSGRHASQESALRFVQEAQALGQLEHPNIVPIHDLGVDEQGRVFYTMKFVKGRTLHEVLEDIRTGKPETIAEYPLSQLLTIFQKVCDAVSYAHSKGVIHRDLKPENIMLGEYGEVLVMDWGLAKIMRLEDGGQKAEGGSQKSEDGGQSSEEKAEGQPESKQGQGVRTMEGRVMGTPNYMAPEQADGRIKDIDARTDVFALGGILYAILTLHPPFTGRSVREILDRILKGEVTPPSSHRSTPDDPTQRDAAVAREKKFPHCPGNQVPAPLSAVAMKALAKDPEQRYRTVKRLQKDIEAYQHGFATVAEGAGLFKQLRLLVKRHKREARLVAAGVTIVAVLVAAFALNLRQSQHRINATVARLQGVVPILAEQATSLIEKQRFEEALQLIEDAITLNPKSAQYHVLKGNLSESLSRFMQARDAYAQALKLNPDDTPARSHFDLCRRIIAASAGAQGSLMPHLEELHSIMVQQKRFSEALVLGKRIRDERERVAADNPVRAERNKPLYETCKGVLDAAGIDPEGILNYDAARVHLHFRRGRTPNLSLIAGMPLSSLTFYWEDTIDLTPLQGLRLQSLELGGSQDPSRNKVSDLSMLKGMPLERLRINMLPLLTDLSFLADMPLTEFYLDHTRVSDLSALKGKKLVSLNVSQSPVSSIEVVRGMPLRSIHLAYSSDWIGRRVTDLSPLEGMQLTDLGLGNVPASNLDFLTNQPITSLDLSGVQITSLNFVRHLPLKTLAIHRMTNVTVADLKGLRIESLWWRGMSITNLNVLAGLPLTHLALGGSLVEDLSPLRGMRLSSLFLEYTKVADLSPLRGMPLTHLILHHTSVRDLSSLEGMLVNQLNLNATAVEDLSPLKGMPLRELTLHDCPNVRDLAPLAQCLELEKLTIPKQCQEIDFLRQLPKLRHLDNQDPYGAWTKTAAEFWREREKQNRPVKALPR